MSHYTMSIKYYLKLRERLRNYVKKSVTATQTVYYTIHGIEILISFPFIRDALIQ